MLCEHELENYQDLGEPVIGVKICPKCLTVAVRGSGGFEQISYSSFFNFDKISNSVDQAYERNNKPCACGGVK